VARGGLSWKQAKAGWRLYPAVIPPSMLMTEP